MKLIDPRCYVAMLPVPARKALLRAHQHTDGSLTVAPDQTRDLLKLGLCEARGRCLTAYGMAVRRELIRGVQ